MVEDWTDVLDAAENPDGRLAIALRAHPSAVASDAPEWIDVRLRVEAFPFSGIVECIWLADDIAALAIALATLAESAETTFTIGGNRTLELRLGGGESLARDGETAIHATLTSPSADAPNLELTWWPCATAAHLADAGELAARLAADWR